MMIREVQNVVNKSVTVEITREITVDQLYKIQPTEAYLGVECGTVRVMFIGCLSELLDYSEEASSQADEYARVQLDLLDKEFYAEEDKRLRTQPWVVYQYSRLPRDTYIFPLEEFVIHTTQY